ncbi:hypothetical protein ADUPG1_010969, partial [Aduncisulcus paluster]
MRQIDIYSRGFRYKVKNNSVLENISLPDAIERKRKQTPSKVSFINPTSYTMKVLEDKFSESGTTPLPVSSAQAMEEYSHKTVVSRDKFIEVLQEVMGYDVSEASAVYDTLDDLHHGVLPWEKILDHIGALKWHSARGGMKGESQGRLFPAYTTTTTTSTSRFTHDIQHEHSSTLLVGMRGVGGATCSRDGLLQIFSLLDGSPIRTLLAPTPQDESGISIDDFGNNVHIMQAALTKRKQALHKREKERKRRLERQRSLSYHNRKTSPILKKNSPSIIRSSSSLAKMASSTESAANSFHLTHQRSTPTTNDKSTPSTIFKQRPIGISPRKTPVKTRKSPGRPASALSRTLSSSGRVGGSKSSARTTGRSTPTPLRGVRPKSSMGLYGMSSPAKLSKTADKPISMHLVASPKMTLLPHKRTPLPPSTINSPHSFPSLLLPSEVFHSVMDENKDMTAAIESELSRLRFEEDLIKYGSKKKEIDIYRRVMSGGASAASGGSMPLFTLPSQRGAPKIVPYMRKLPIAQPPRRSFEHDAVKEGLVRRVGVKLRNRMRPGSASGSSSNQKHFYSRRDIRPKSACARSRNKLSAEDEYYEKLVNDTYLASASYTGSRRKRPSDHSSSSSLTSDKSHPFSSLLLAEPPQPSTLVMSVIKSHQQRGWAMSCCSDVLSHLLFVGTATGLVIYDGTKGYEFIRKLHVPVCVLSICISYRKVPRKDKYTMKDIRKDEKEKEAELRETKEKWRKREEEERIKMEKSSPNGFCPIIMDDKEDTLTSEDTEHNPSSSGSSQITGLTRSQNPHLTSISRAFSPIDSFASPSISPDFPASSSPSSSSSPNTYLEPSRKTGAMTDAASRKTFISADAYVRGSCFPLIPSLKANTRIICIGGSNGHLFFYDLKDLNPILTDSETHSHPPQVMCSIRGMKRRMVAVGDTAGLISIWDIDTLTLLNTISLPSAVMSLSFSPAHALICAATVKSGIYLISIFSLSICGRIITSSAPLVGAWATLTNQVVAVHEDKSIALYCIKTLQLQQSAREPTPQGLSDKITQANFVQGLNLLLIGGCVIRQWVLLRKGETVEECVGWREWQKERDEAMWEEEEIVVKGEDERKREADEKEAVRLACMSDEEKEAEEMIDRLKLLLNCVREPEYVTEEPDTIETIDILDDKTHTKGEGNDDVTIMEEKEEEREEEEEEEEEEEDGSSSMTDYDICTSDEYDIDRDRMDIIGVNSQRKKPSPSIVPPLTLSKCEKLGISQPGGGVVLSAGGRASSINLHSPTFTERNILNHLRDDAFIELQQEMERKGKEEDGDSSKHKAKGKKEKKKHKKKITLKKRKGGVVKKKKKNNTKKTKGKKTIGKSLK